MAQAKKWITPREFARWKEYYKVEPFGEQRDDLRTAVLICYLLNGLGHTKRTIEPNNILPFLSDSTTTEKPKMTARERGIALERKFAVGARLHNATPAGRGAG